MSVLRKNAIEPVPRRRVERHVPGEEGAWVFILGDMTVFAGFFAAYLAARAHNPELFAASQRTLNQSYGAINTLLLLTSSLFVTVGIRAVRRNAHRVAPWCFAGAFCCGLGFASVKFLEYSDKIHHGLLPTTNEFFMYYYVLTGLHLFHLTLGMAVLVFLFVKARKPALTVREFAFVEGGACFWHMVDVLWIVLFPLLYLAR
jgi:nitric oxide reductase NorE protein